MMRMGPWMLGVAAAAGCAVAPEVSWHADINPMMQTHCVRCHSEAGQGVGDFTNMDTVQTFSGRIQARMDEGTMPPATSDPECRDYVNSEHVNLPADQIALFDRWVELEMPEGREADAPVLELPSLVLEDADLKLQPPEPYAPAFADPQNPANEYRCFVLDHGRDEDFFVTAFQPIVDQPELVHHVLLFAMDTDRVPADYDPAVGVDCIDGRGGAIGDLDSMIAGWAPGMEPVRFDDGRGVLVQADQSLVVQTHLYRKGPEVDDLTDRTGWALRTADSVATPMIMAPLGTYDFRIPAGDEDYSHADSVELPVSVTLHAVFPHMHVLGKRYRVWTEAGDGAETCVAEGAYDFDNQLSYILKEPLKIPAGTTVNLECTWDNSKNNPDRILDEPVEVRYGDRTDQEMCFAFSLVSIGL